jgi:hypothetical protein
MADTEEEVFEFVVPGLGCRLVDHDGRLPRPLPLPTPAAHDRGAAP